MRILKVGINGPDTERVQGFLKDEGFYFGRVDGLFGPATRNAVILYQKSRNLIQDGIIGGVTYSAMKEDGFERDGTEIESLDIDKSEIKKIIAANSFQLICPPNRNNPEATSFDPENHVIAVAIRGFKLNSMGKFGENDRRIYDDAHFIVTPNEVKAYEGNTDPNGYRKGRGTGANKGMACLKKGVWFFGKGPHKGSPAFRQCCPFTVIRDGSPDYEDTGYHAINWHSAGNVSTSSLGCQTNRPHDFVSLRNFIYNAMEEFNNPFMKNDWDQRCRAIPYILIEEKDRRSGNLVA